MSTSEVSESSAADATSATDATWKTAVDRLVHRRSVWMWFWLGLLSVTLPMMWIYFSRMWRLPHYQYFPFAILAVGYLAWQRGDGKFYPPGSLLSIVFLAAGGMALGLGWMAGSPWLVAIAFVAFAAGCLQSMRGDHDASLVMLALPLILLIRLPLGYDQLLVIELQQITTSLSSLMLDVLNIPHAVAQNVLNLPGRELFVAEACSGIQSVFTMAFVSTLMIAIWRRRIGFVPVYLVIALLLAVAGNVLRVTTVAAVDYGFGWDWASGWAHDLLGYVTLGLAVLVLFSFDRLVVALLHPISRLSGSAMENPFVIAWNWSVHDGSIYDAAEEYTMGREAFQVASRRKDSIVEGWLDRIPARPLTYGIMAVSLFLTGMSFERAHRVAPMNIEGGVGSMFADGMIWQPAEDEFGAVVGDFELTSYRQIRDGADVVLGNNADLWVYTGSPAGVVPVVGQFVISQSYEEWHELCLCYELRDWRLLSRTGRAAEASVSPESGTSGRSVPHVYAMFKNEVGQRGYLWYGAVSAGGELIEAPSRPGRLGSRLSAAIDATPANDEPVMMVQLWVADFGEELGELAVSAATRDFVNLIATVADAVRERKSSTSEQP